MALSSFCCLLLPRFFLFLFETKIKREEATNPMSFLQPVCRRHSGPGGFDSFELLVERSDSTWIANLRDPKSTNNLHYLYPVHASRSFLFTPTFASALYLLLLRLIGGLLLFFLLKRSCPLLDVVALT